MKKVLLAATVQSHIAQFHKPLIQMLHENNYEVHVSARNNLAEKNGLSLETPDMIYDIPFDRSPLSKNNIRAYNQLKCIIKENKYDIIHCNTPMGGVVTRLAAKSIRKYGTKVYYTAHGFHFYKGAPLRNWLLYYPIEKWLANYTDKLITISEEDFALAIKKRFKTDVRHIHGVGANTDKYQLPTNELIANIRTEEGFQNDDFICICTGELNKNKNQSTIIESVPMIINRIPNFKLLLAGNGPMYNQLEKLINDYNLQNYVKLIGYRTDLERYVMMSNVVVSASFREGLGLNLIEAMLCGKPIIGSINRGHSELISHMQNGLLVNPLDSHGFAKAIMKLHEDKDLFKQISNNSLESAEKYTSKNVITELERIYELI